MPIAMQSLYMSFKHNATFFVVESTGFSLPNAVMVPSPGHSLCKSMCEERCNAIYLVSAVGCTGCKRVCLTMEPVRGPSTAGFSE